MPTSGRYWQAWFKTLLTRMTVADWLTLLLLLVFGWLSTQVVTVTSPGTTSMTLLFPYFLSGAVILGYCYRPAIKQRQLALTSSGTWLTIAKSAGLTFVLVSLPLLVLNAVQPATNDVIWLRTISTLLVVVSATMAGVLSSRLPKRWGMPLLLATLWWVLFGGSHIIENLSSAITVNNLITQLVVLMIAIGSFGFISALIELTQTSLRDVPPSHFIKIWAFDRPMPSFTGMGSLLIVGLLRIVRDKVFLIYLGAFVVILLSRVLVANLLVDWLVIIELCLAGISVLVVTRLVKFSKSISTHYSHLPISPGQVDFVGFFAGLTLMAAISWVIIWGLFGVTAEIMIRLIIATVSGYGAGFLVGLYSRRIEHRGTFDSFWDLIAQLLVFSLVFLYSLGLSLSGATISLIALILSAVTVTCYQVTRSWATIKS